MSNSISPCSTRSAGSEILQNTSFPLMDEMGFLSDGGFSPRWKHCKFCKEDSSKITSNWFEETAAEKTSNISKKECRSKLFTISEKIYGLYCSETVDHSIQLQNIYSAISQAKKNKNDSKVKIFSLIKVCSAVSTFGAENVTFLIEFSKPSQLMPILKFCENLFDWLAKDDDNLAFLYCNTDETILLTMAYAYSCYYDSLPRRDIRQSVAIKSFLNLHAKGLEKVPISYRRYAGYMSLYSCMNQLQSYRSSVNLYCLILYNIPAMESNKSKTSQLFFKIYTNEPLKCSHTTKLYCLPSHVNRLVILFDQYPIILRGDTMILCYHRSLTGSKRTKILRINFHTCQAVSEMLSFYSQDFEDLYPGCPFKMKLDLYFQATAVFGQGEANFVCDTSLSNLSQLERYDSYTSLSENKPQRSHSSLSSIQNKNVRSSFTIFKTKMDQVSDKKSPVKKIEEKKIDQKITNEEEIKSEFQSKTDQKNTNMKTVNEEKSINEIIKTKSEDNPVPSVSVKVINNNGRITGPVDSHHSTKLETVRTSSTMLNGSSSKPYETKEIQNISSNNNSYAFGSFSEGEKCSKQLDNLLRDLNLGTSSSVSPSIISNPYTSSSTTQRQYNIQSNTTNQREIQLMSELLEAQKEISNLRRSMNHLDMIDHPRSLKQESKSNVFSKSHSLVKGNVNGYASDTCSGDIPRQRMWTSNQKANNTNITSSIERLLPKTNEYFQKTNVTQDFHSTDGRTTPSTYSAHRENIKLEQSMKEKCFAEEKICIEKNQTDLESTDILEEVETINLQPIGKGIQDLYKGNSPSKGTRGATLGGNCRYDQGSHNFINESGNFSPILMKQNFSVSKVNTGSNSRLHEDVLSHAVTTPSLFIREDSQLVNLQSVEEKVQWWYQPQLSREEAIVILKHSYPGSFLIRDSNTYSGAYGLAVKVASIPPNIMPKSDDLESEKVRHYLIEPMGNQGVCFKGFPEEPVFPSLTNLVLYYTHTLSVLPCLLVLPNRALYENPRLTMTSPTESHMMMSSPKLQSQLNNNKNGYSIYYLGCYDVEYITGPSVINKAIERLLADLDARKFTECQLRINPNDGIVLTDMERKLFFRRHHPFANISYCALDPRDRKIELDVCKSKGVRKTKLFGLIIKNYVAGESKCFLFGELDPTQKASFIVKAIGENLQRFNQI